MNLLLVISSGIALALLVVHSWRMRGRAVTLIFFVAATIFGFLRGNVVWFIISRLEKSAETMRPYIPQGGLLPEIGHESIQVAVGWVFAMYLAWTIAEGILERLPRLAGRVFMIGGLASLFMLAICYCMETAAAVAGWWYWTMPTRTALFGDVNAAAMWAWFSVVPDFLIPFLVIVCSTSGRRAVSRLWALVFPLHMLAHLGFTRMPYLFLVYHVMVLMVIVLMLFSRLRMARGSLRAGPPGSSRATAALPGIALIIFFGVLVLANVARGGGPAKALTLIPMLMLCLLAWRRLPAWAVAGLSVLALSGWAWIGPRALYALAPVAVYAFLRLLDRPVEPLWPKLAAIAAAIALSAAAALSFAADGRRAQRYVNAWMEGDRFAMAGDVERSADAYARADGMRPHDPIAFYVAAMSMTRLRDVQADAAAAVLGRRIPRVMRELEEIIRRDPEWILPRKDLAHLCLLAGKLSGATEQYRRMHRCRPEDGEVLAMLGYLLLREEKVAEAESACDRAMRLKDAPVEVLINMGVIRLHQGRDDEARRLWQLARSRDSRNPIARINLERLDAGSREIDVRYLARAAVGANPAMLATCLAIYGKGYSEADRVRLFLEATQFEPAFLPAHWNLARVYLQEGPLQDKERALWHARRAVAITRESPQGADLAGCLLALGRALIANGREDEARLALEEGKRTAPAEIVGEFDRLLGTLNSPRR